MPAITPYDERRVLKQLAEGNEVAFNEIYSRYSPLVYREAFRFLRSSELSKDLVQEIFTTLWNLRTNFTGVEHFRAYLITMSKNLAYQYLLKLSKEALAKKELAYSLNASVTNMEQELNHKELEILLESTVNLLPRQQKQVFHLAKTNGLSYEAIAQRLSISPNTVKNHLVAANHFIRKRIKDSLTLTSLLFVVLYRIVEQS